MSEKEATLVKALDQFVRDRANPHPSSDPPNATGWQTFFLFLFALSLALTFAYFESLYRNAFVEIITKLVPFIFGASLVTSLDSVRTRLINASTTRLFVGFVLALFLFSSSAHLINLFQVKVPVRTVPGAWIDLNGGTYQQGFSEEWIEIPLKGIEQQKVTVRDVHQEGLHPHTYYLSARDRYRATWISRVLHGRYIVELPSLYPVVFHKDTARLYPPEITIEGIFADQFLRAAERRHDTKVKRLNRRGKPEESERGLFRDSAQVRIILSREAGPEGHWFPEGKYMLQIRDSPTCTRMQKPLSVQADGPEPEIAIDSLSYTCTR